MLISIECKSCEKVMETHVSNIIKPIIECAENGSIYAGFLCKDCAEELEDEFNENN